MDPVPTMAATMGILKGLHHPYAAMLLVDYILSKEGQGILARRRVFSGASRCAAAAGTLAPVVPKIAGVPENFVGPDKLIKYTDSSERNLQELFR